MEKETKKKRKVIHKIGFVLLGIFLGFLLVSLFNLIFSSEPEFIIYKNGTEVNYLTIKSGFSSTDKWNTTKFEECANESYQYDDWYDFIYECMGGVGLSIIYSNVTKDLINFKFLELNCEKVDDKTFTCGKYKIIYDRKF